MMFTGVCFAQGSYKYGNLTVTASSGDGEVSWDGIGFLLKVDGVSIEIMMNRDDVSVMTIHNTGKDNIISRWKQFSVSNLSYLYNAYEKEPKKYKKFARHYYDAKVDPSLLVSNPLNGEETIYPDGVRSYSFQYTGEELFPQKLDKVIVDIDVPLVVNNKENTYRIVLTGVRATE